MASPLNTTKQTVNLAAAGPRVSRIRRNPPPTPRKDPVLDREDREKLSALFGVIAFALAVVVLVAGVGIYAGWSPREVELYLQMN